MNLAISDGLKPLLKQYEDYVTNELIPLEPQFFSKPFSELVPLLNEKRAQVKSLGLWGPQIPPELGGVRLTLVEHGYFRDCNDGEEPQRAPCHAREHVHRADEHSRLSYFAQHTDHG
jgi:hypothetical protein